MLEEKREEIYKFLASPLTLIIVSALWLSFVFGAYSSFSSFGAEGGTFLSQVFSLALTLGLGIILPVGYSKLFNGSKKKDPGQVQSGLGWLILYFKVLKIILIIAAVISGLALLITLFVAFEVLVTIIITGLMFALSFYILAIFKDFLEQMNQSFNSGYSTVPSASKIRTYSVVIMILTIILALIFAVAFQNISDLIPANFEAEFEPILELLDSLVVIFYIAMGISIISQGFFIYYLTKFENGFSTFNTYFKKKVEEAKRNIVETIE